MKYFLPILFCLLTSPIHAASPQLLFSDDFSTPGLPDPKKWSYETGYIRNNELQLYTKSRLENARIEDGNLILEGRKEKFKNPAFDPNSKNPKNREFADYTSASITTQDN